jgi:hypothetical protein
MGGLMKSKIRDSITVVDREKNKDRRSGPRAFIDLEVGKEEEVLVKVLKCGVVKGVGHSHSPWSHQGRILALRAKEVDIRAESTKKRVHRCHIMVSRD